MRASMWPKSLSPWRSAQMRRGPPQEDPTPPDTHSRTSVPASQRQFLGFLVASGVAAAANFGSRIIFSIWMTYSASIITAFCVGLVTAFVLNRTFVFAAAANAVHEQVLWFILINMVAAVQTLFVSLFLARYLFPHIGFGWHVETVAHAAGIAVPILTSYIGHKRLTFKGS